MSRIIVNRILLSVVVTVFFTQLYGQTQYLTPFAVSGGTRTLYIDNPTVSNCPNTYEYVPDGFNINDPTTKYPIIIGFPGLGEMISQFESTSAAMDKFINTNIFLSAGIQQVVERNEFPATTTYNSQQFKFIVIGVQCKNNANLPSQTPFDVENLINNYILVKYAHKVDWNRIYMTGLSAGGGLVWEYFENAKRGAKIAAIVPIAPGTVYIDTETGEIETMPIDYTSNVNAIINNIVAHPTLGVYAAHNQNDQSVDVKVSQRFVNGINAIQPGRAFLNIYTDPPQPSDHNAWTRSYDPTRNEFNGSNMYQWMLSHQTTFAALPVTLTSFEAIAKNSSVELTWKTASESNSSYFAVERSSNGNDFKEIGRVNASGNSSTTKSYKFIDATPLSGNNYYRLKMVDLDATFKFSEVRKLSLQGSNTEFTFGPNPVLNEAHIQISGKQRTQLHIKITDLMGRTIKTLTAIKSDNLFSQNINLADLPSGQYILSVKGENINYTQRLLKK